MSVVSLSVCACACVEEEENLFSYCTASCEEREGGRERERSWPGRVDGPMSDGDWSGAGLRCVKVHHHHQSESPGRRGRCLAVWRCIISLSLCCHAFRPS